MPFPNELETDRLYLRPAREDDAELIFRRYGQDPQVSRYMSWTPHRSLDDTLEFLRRRIGANQEGKSAGYLIFSRDTGELLGDIGGGIGESRIQFGYCLARDAWGHGFATEAALAFVAIASSEPSIWRVQAYCDVENRASARVLEKVGLTFEGTLRHYLVLPNLGDVARDVYCYAKVHKA